MLVVAVVAEDGEAYAVGLAGPTRLDRSLRRRAATLLTVDAPAKVSFYYGHLVQDWL